MLEGACRRGVVVWEGRRKRMAGATMHHLHPAYGNRDSGTTKVSKSQERHRKAEQMPNRPLCDEVGVLAAIVNSFYL